MWRRMVVAGLAGGIVAILAFWLWPAPRPNVLVITLDTTRADRLGCYGYRAARTPELDALAASGVLCERAYSVAPLTLPAHASLLTGLYPAETGVRSNGRGRLDESIPSLAEMLRRHGYATGAFVASFVLESRFGLSRGFRTYDDDIVREQQPSAESHDQERDGREVVDAALAWLEDMEQTRFFCWVHLYDPHAPYRAHADLFGEEFAGRPYDAEIAYVDQQVGRLVDFLKRRKLAANTLVVVVGDHGEGLREHHEFRHGMTLYNTVLHVPLIFCQPGRLPPRRVAENVSLVDVAPTVLKLLNLPELREIAGRSLAARLQGRPGPPSICYGATDEPFLDNGWCPLRSLTVDSWKYIRTTRPELYDLANDPDELHNLAESDPERAGEMESRLAEFESRLVRRAETEVALRADEKQALQSLGYLGGGSRETGADEHSPRTDVKDVIQFEAAIDEAAEMMDHGDIEAAVARLRDVVQHVPDYAKAHGLLAAALSRQSRFGEAIEVLQALLAKKPDALEAQYLLGTMLLGQGREEDAIAALQKTLELEPTFTAAHYDLASILARRGQLVDALTHLDAILAVDRRHVAARAAQAALLARMGESNEPEAKSRRQPAAPAGSQGQP